LSNEFIRFWHILLAAEEQLQWGTDPHTIRHSAAALRQVSPHSLLVGQLEAKAVRLQRLARRLARPVGSSVVNPAP
jgi:hypothetical protein